MAYIKGKRVLFANVNINDSGNSYKVQSKTVTPSTKSNLTVRPDTGYYGLSSVTVKQIKLATSTVIPSKEKQVITPSSEFDGLSSITVEPIPESYNKQGWPIEVSDYQTMTDIINNATTDQYGMIYKYVGESNGVFVKNGIYIITPDSGLEGLN